MRYRDRFDFVAVYVREAHPTDGWRMESNDKAGVAIAQPKTNQERVRAADLCCTALEMKIPIVIDSIDNATERAYSAFPDRLYLIDRGGRVAYKGGRGPFGYSPRELEQAMLLLLADERFQRL